MCASTPVPFARSGTYSIDAPVRGHDNLRAEPPSHEVDPSDRLHHKEIASAVQAAIERLVRESDWRGGILYAVLLALCLYTHNYSLFLLPVGSLFALTYKPGRWRALLLTGG